MVGIGLLAGAAGTLALDLYTYGDILVRARPSSELPSNVVKTLATSAKIGALSGDDETAQNRRSGAGALMGYGVGLGAAVAYAALRPAFRDWLPWPIAGLLLGAATLVTSEGSATALGVTDWAQWTPSEWASDVVPRALYGLTAAYVVERLTEEPEFEIEFTDSIEDEDEDEIENVTFLAVPDVDTLPPGSPRSEVGPLDPAAIEADEEVNPHFA